MEIYYLKVKGTEKYLKFSKKKGYYLEENIMGAVGSRTKKILELIEPTKRNSFVVIKKNY